MRQWSWASQVVLVTKNPPANAGDTRDVGLIPGPGRSPGGEKDIPLQYSCLKNPLEGYSPWGCKQSDTTEYTHAQGVILLKCQPVSPACFWEATFSHLTIWTTWDTRHSPPWLSPQVISWFCHLIFSSLPARCPFPPSRHGFYIFI